LGPIGPAVSEEIIFKLFFVEFSIFSNGGHAQTMVKWSLDGPLSELYPTTLPAEEDGGHC
jgi:hypothetical protein